MRNHPLRVLRFHGEIMSAIAGHVVAPIRALLDLTNLCNHNCPWCEPLEYRKETIRDKKHTLPLAVVLETLEDLARMGTKTLMFSGAGEPLQHPYFGTALRAAKSLGMKVAINTNGAFILKWLEDIRLADTVRISLDATNAKEHEIQHGKARDFEGICDGICTLAGYKDGPEIGIALVTSECNRQSLPALESLRVKLGADFVYPREERGQTFGARNFRKCYSALTVAVIGANGDVQACCDRRDIVFGNVNDTPFREIWLSAAHRETAARIVPNLCQKCLQHAYNENVKRFVMNDESQSWIG